MMKTELCNILDIEYPVRVISNKLACELKQMEKDGITAVEFEKKGTGALARAVKGDVTCDSVMAGQIAGLVNTVRPFREIIQEIVNDTEKVVLEIGEKVFSI